MSELTPILEVQQPLETAIAAYERQLAALYRPDGQPMYTDHAARVAALRDQLSAAIATADSQLAQRIESTNQALARARSVDLVDLLSVDELNLANAQRPYVEEDAAQMNPAELQARLEAIAAGDSRVSMFLWTRAATRRVAEFSAARARGDRVSDGDIVAMRQVQTLTTAIAARFAGGNQSAQLQALQEAQEREQQTRMYINRRRELIASSVRRQLPSL